MKLNNDDFWPKDPDFDINEVMENDFKFFTYEELFNMSYPISESDFKKYNKWNLFSVSDVNNIEQIFHDIAHSKKARSIYRKANVYNFFSLIFEIFLVSFLIFSICGTFISLNHTFLLKTNDWIKILYSSFFCWLYACTMNDNYSPIHFDNTFINFWYPYNKTLWYEVEYLWLGSFYLHFKKPKNKSSYHIYKAINGQNYLTDLKEQGRYYTMRNWYLISKHIVLKKLKVDDLPSYYQDNLFFYLNNQDFKEDKLKIKCFFSLKFSLNFFGRIRGIMSLLIILIPLFSIVTALVISGFYL